MSILTRFTNFLKAPLHLPSFVKPKNGEKNLATIAQKIPLTEDTFQRHASSASNSNSAIQQLRKLLPEEVFKAIETSVARLPLLKDVELEYIADGSNSKQQLERFFKLGNALLKPSVKNIHSLLEDPKSPTKAEQALKYTIIERFYTKVDNLQDKIRFSAYDTDYKALTGINTEKYPEEIASGSKRAKIIIPVLRKLLEEDIQLLLGDAPYKPAQFNDPSSCVPNLSGEINKKMHSLLSRQAELNRLLDNTNSKFK
jgi:uncharacterized phage infection (PIP) family protein YhgE